MKKYLLCILFLSLPLHVVAHPPGMVDSELVHSILHALPILLLFLSLPVLYRIMRVKNKKNRGD